MAQTPQIILASPPKLIRKFNFSDFKLAKNINSLIRQKLISFDDNRNGNFEEPQIRQALFQILNEKQEELQYVVNNVFRYDVNSDGAVTYDQFVRFCTQMHFGQLAIQRMHMRNAYQFGRQRIMSQSQFAKTLNYCFSSLKYKVQDDLLSKLFSQIDLDKDGFISYEDYFIFLRQYFGESEQVSLNEQKYWQQIRRVANLIFPQILTLIAQFDIYKSMQLLKPDIETFIQRTFKSNNKTPISLASFSKPTLNYSQTLQKVLQVIFSGSATTSSSRQLTSYQFISQFNNEQLFGVKIKPAQYLLQQIYVYLSNAYRKQSGSQIYLIFLNNLAKVYRENL